MVVIEEKKITARTKKHQCLRKHCKEQEVFFSWKACTQNKIFCYSYCG